MSYTKPRNPRMRAGIKSEGGYFNCNIFMGARKDGTDAMTVGVNTPDGQTGFTNLQAKTDKNGKPYLSGVVTIGESKYLVKIDQIRTEDHNFLVLGISGIEGTPENLRFTPLSTKGCPLYPNELAKGSKLEAAFREVFTDLPANAFEDRPRRSAAHAREQTGKQADDTPSATHATSQTEVNSAEDAFIQDMGF